jgi:hypothetical protein
MTAEIGFMEKLLKEVVQQQGPDPPATAKPVFAFGHALEQSEPELLAARRR